MLTPTLAFLGTTELIIILVIIVIIFGVGKLPEVGKQLGEGIKNFKREINEDDDGTAKEIEDEAETQTRPPRDVTAKPDQAGGSSEA